LYPWYLPRLGLSVRRLHNRYLYCRLPTAVFVPLSPILLHIRAVTQSLRLLSLQATLGAAAPLLLRSAAAMKRSAQKMRLTQSNCVVAHVDMSALPQKRQAQPPSTPQSSNDALGVVQDILAERTSTTLGCSEVLVAWKPCWIPITNVQDGHILRNWRAATKCYFLSASGKLLLPVEPDSALADDMDAVAARTQRQLELQAQQERGTLRKSLGSVATRAAPTPSDDSDA